jgi:hypothetical protein
LSSCEEERVDQTILSRPYNPFERISIKAVRRAIRVEEVNVQLQSTLSINSNLAVTNFAFLA